MRILQPFILALAAGAAHAQEAKPEPDVEAALLGHGLYLLTGRGGNIVASIGADGVFLVDDQYAPATPRIKAALARFTDQPVRFVVNTHWHGDHTGGNENLGTAGAVIVAHDNVRKRMSTEQFIAEYQKKVAPSPHAALPVVSFGDRVSLHLNGHEVRALHVAHAHTDGDAIVHFPDANVLHMGDAFWNGLYPFIDLSSGGTIDGAIDAVERGLELADAQTKVVPGHGPLADRAALERYRDMLVESRARIAKLKAKKRSLKEIAAAQPLADFDRAWGGGFIKSEQFLRFVHDSLPVAKRRKGR